MGTFVRVWVLGCSLLFPFVDIYYVLLSIPRMDSQKNVSQKWIIIITKEEEYKNVV